MEIFFLDYELFNGDLKVLEIVFVYKEEIDFILLGISDIIDFDMYMFDDYVDKMGDV